MSNSSTGSKAAIGALVIGLAAVVGFVPLIAGSVGGDSNSAVAAAASLLVQASQACVATGPVPGLDSEQATDANQIVAAAFAASGENQDAARIALMVAYTESTLENLGPMTGNDGSLGLFQQRGWGTPQQEMDPTTATGLFMRPLLALANWQQLPPWVAAQTVQKSKFSDGSNYEANWALAGQLLDQVLNNGNQLGSCGQGVPNGVAGPAGSFGLPAGYAVPAGTGPAHSAVVNWALQQLGKPYVWAAAGPAAFDCSGLTMAAWAIVGAHLDHYTGDQQTEGVAVQASTLMAGDLVLVPGSDAPGPGVAGHVGIYLGDGLVESAIDPKDGTAVQSWQTFIGGGLDALRDPDPADG